MKDFAKRAAHWLYQKPLLLVILTTLMWSGNALAGKLAVGQVSPMIVVMMRWVLVSIVLVVFFRKMIVAEWPLLKGRWIYVFCMGGIGFTFFNVVFYIAAHLTTGVNMTLLQGAVPVFVLVGGYLVYRTPINAAQWCGFLVTIAGVVTISARGDLEILRHLSFNLGDIGLLISCLFLAGYVLALRQKPQISGMALFAAFALCAFMSSIPFVLIENRMGLTQWPTPFGWGIIAYVSLFPSLAAQIFFIRAIELIGASRASLFTNLLPVFGAFLSVLVLGEPFGLYHAVSLLLVVGGIMIAEQVTWSKLKGA